MSRLAKLRIVLNPFLVPTETAQLREEILEGFRLGSFNFEAIARDHPEPLELAASIAAHFDVCFRRRDSEVSKLVKRSASAEYCQPFVRVIWRAQAITSFK